MGVLLDIGLDVIESRVRALTSHLIEEAERKGIGVATPRPWWERAGIVALRVPDARAVAERLKEKRILVSVKDGHLLRASCHIYNTEDEVDRLVAAVAARGN